MKAAIAVAAFSILLFASACCRNTGAGYSALPAQIADAQKPELVLESGHNLGALSVAFSPDGRTLASGSGDYTVKLWEVGSGRELRTLAGHSDDVRSVAFGPDGRTLASGSKDKTMKLWDVASGRELHTFVGHTGMVRCVAFSPDGRKLASGSDDHKIKLWDVASGRELRSLAGVLRKNSMNDIDPSFECSAFAVCTLVFHSSGPRREVASSSTQSSSV